MVAKMFRQFLLHNSCAQSTDSIPQMSSHFMVLLHNNLNDRSLGQNCVVPLGRWRVELPRGNIAQLNSGPFWEMIAPLAEGSGI